MDTLGLKDVCEHLQNPNTLNISGHIYKILKRSLKCKPREDELILSCENLAFKCLVTRYMILVQLRLVAFHNFISSSSPFWLRFPLF